RNALETKDSAATMDQVHQSGGLSVRERAAGGGPPARKEPAEPADGPGPPSTDSQMALFLAGRGTDPEEVTDESASGPASGSPDLSTGIDAIESPRLWQVHRSWILAEVRDGILLIDQHAAHERVLFERIMRRFDEGGEPSQRLLFPMTIRLTAAEYLMVEDLRGLLAQAGFDVEGFGGDTVIVHAVPMPHPYFDAERSFREIIDELTHGSELVRSARNQYERVAMSFACKAAIKAGQALDDREIQELFDQLFATGLPYHDVHGRPTTVRLSRGELERKFGR
ncbi:MAG: hypothetical protein WD013_00050, partial [Gemmatimonadota bacterium]